MVQQRFEHFFNEQAFQSIFVVMLSTVIELAQQNSYLDWALWLESAPS